MNRTLNNAFVAGVFVSLLFLVAAPLEVEAQGRGNREREAEARTGITLTVEAKAQIQQFYGSRPASSVEGLPPGIRRNLERGKALPPGIAKKSAPPELQSRLELTSGFELVEVGLDVFLVEVATSIIHDVLMDVIR